MPFSNPTWLPSKKWVVSPGPGSPFPPANRVLGQHRPHLCNTDHICAKHSPCLVFQPTGSYSLPCPPANQCQVGEQDGSPPGHGHPAALLPSPAPPSLPGSGASPARPPPLSHSGPSPWRSTWSRGCLVQRHSLPGSLQNKCSPGAGHWQ